MFSGPCPTPPIGFLASLDDLVLGGPVAAGALSLVIVTSSSPSSLTVGSDKTLDAESKT